MLVSLLLLLTFYENIIRTTSISSVVPRSRLFPKPIFFLSAEIFQMWYLLIVFAYFNDFYFLSSSRSSRCLKHTPDRNRYRWSSSSSSASSYVDEDEENRGCSSSTFLRWSLQHARSDRIFPFRKLTSLIWFQFFKQFIGHEMNA